MSSSGGSEDRIGRRERIGKKVQEATKGLLAFSIRKGSVVPGTESPTGAESPKSNDGSYSAYGSSALNSPSKVQPFTLLFLYSQTNNAEKLKELLEEKPDLVKAKDYDERSALHIAAIHGCIQAAEVLLDHGAAINAIDRWKNSIILFVDPHMHTRRRLRNQQRIMTEMMKYMPPPTHNQLALRVRRSMLNQDWRGGRLDSGTGMKVASNRILYFRRFPRRKDTKMEKTSCFVHALTQKEPLADAKAPGNEKMRELLESKGAKSLGCHGQEVKALAPPTLRKSDWEIDPLEIDLEHSDKIGKGSFGEIRMTHWRGTPVAVKTILPALSDDRLVVLDFRHEVELLVKVRHPNIVQFLGAVTNQPPLMLITEYLSGGDLHTVMKQKGPLTIPTIVSYALDMARGMTYLHNGPNMIIHRDLKPRNVLLGENNQLKVGDFGLSKLIKAKNMVDIYKMTGETGSYRYMAPEVFEHRRYDKSVDVFSFGVILYEMCEDTPPFSELDAYEAARVVAKERARPEFTDNTPEDMIKLIKDCWKHNPADRPEFQVIIKKLETISTSIVCPKEHHHLWPFTT